jgi:Na+/melibiose symporter-like transporter
MDAEIKKWASQQDFLALLYSLILAVISTAVIWILDKFMFKHTDFSPLTEFQFYGILFIVVFGFVACLMFYRGKEETVEEVSEFRTKMTKKKLKKSKKAKVRSR